MTDHIRRSRITKALTDASLVSSFPEAEARLDAVSICVVVAGDQSRTAAGQAATLTVLATAFKCFGRVNLVLGEDADLLVPQLMGRTLLGAAAYLGATTVTAPPDDTTHAIYVGRGPELEAWGVSCWWDGGLSGLRPEGDHTTGDGRLALAGVFAGALAVRDVFANIRGKQGYRLEPLTISLWAPWSVDAPLQGPAAFDVPNSFWILGLGHLGQAFIWNLGFLPFKGPRRVILQDNQRIGPENEPTSLLVTSKDIGWKKARIGERWLEALGWDVDIVERRNFGDVQVQDSDPQMLIAGLDSLPARRAVAGAGFPYMIDAGIGHGPVDFEGLQVRVIPAGANLDGLWTKPVADDRRAKNLATEPYEALAQTSGACGVVPLADASVSVPFVGAATGALVLAQAIRLASLKPAAAVLQMDLNAPHMMMDGGQVPKPEANFGSERILL